MVNIFPFIYLELWMKNKQPTSIYLIMERKARLWKNTFDYGRKEDNQFIKFGLTNEPNTVYQLISLYFIFVVQIVIHNVIT